MSNNNGYLTEKRFNEFQGQLDKKLDGYLTEKRFNEFQGQLDKRFDDFQEQLDKKLDIKLDILFEKYEKRLLEKMTNMMDTMIDNKLDKKLKPIHDTLKTLQGFQDNEANAIEYELEMIIEKYLKDNYPIKTVTKFPIKTPMDPYTDKEITDLDVSFLIKDYKHTYNYSRLKEAGIYMSISKQSNNKTNTIFVLGEAKHYICKRKISDKLSQFDRICNIFKLSRHIIQNPNNISNLGVTDKFLSTVKRNTYLAEISSYILFFGAAFWEKGIMKAFNEAIKQYNELINNFTKASEDKKVAIYYKILAIEQEWYGKDNAPVREDLADDSIKSLDKIEGFGLLYVKLIHPSGDRYKIDTPEHISGYTTISLKGGNKTRRRSGSDDEKN
jgi:hypothetical protein